MNPDARLALRLWSKQVETAEATDGCVERSLRLDQSLVHLQILRLVELSASASVSLLAAASGSGLSMAMDGVRRCAGW